MSCYCGSQQPFEKCCEPFIQGKAIPQSCLELMKSRYSAFCIQNVVYLMETTDTQLKSVATERNYREFAETSKFVGLEIIRHSEEQNKGMVEFKASFEEGGKTYIHHEVSKFRKNGGRWFYRDGKGHLHESGESC